jgi:hypothetical protein
MAGLMLYAVQGVIRKSGAVLHSTSICEIPSQILPGSSGVVEGTFNRSRSTHDFPKNCCSVHRRWGRYFSISKHCVLVLVPPSLSSYSYFFRAPSPGTRCPSCKQHSLSCSRYTLWTAIHGKPRATESLEGSSASGNLRTTELAGYGWTISIRLISCRTADGRSGECGSQSYRR